MLIIEDRGIYDIEDITQWILWRNGKMVLNRMTEKEMALSTGVSRDVVHRLFNKNNNKNRDTSLYSLMKIMKKFGMQMIIVNKDTGKKINITEKNAYLAMQKSVAMEKPGKEELAKEIGVAWETVDYYFRVKTKPEGLKTFFFVKWMERAGYDVWFIEGRAS